MSKYDDLVKKLKEIFQIDRPELDFGVCSIEYGGFGAVLLKFFWVLSVLTSSFYVGVRPNHGLFIEMAMKDGITRCP